MLVFLIVRICFAYFHNSLLHCLHSGIEKIQRRCLRRVFSDVPYNVALKSVNLETLQNRREEACSIPRFYNYKYKRLILHGNVMFPTRRHVIYLALTSFTMYRDFHSVVSHIPSSQAFSMSFI
jgi:hypothetical protein